MTPTGRWAGSLAEDAAIEGWFLVGSHGSVQEDQGDDQGEAADEQSARHDGRWVLFWVVSKRELEQRYYFIFETRIL